MSAVPNGDTPVTVVLTLDQMRAIMDTMAIAGRTLDVVVQTFAHLTRVGLVDAFLSGTVILTEASSETYRRLYGDDLHCHGMISFLQSSTPELGGDWWHIDAAGYPTTMVCGVVESGSSTSMEFAEP